MCLSALMPDCMHEVQFESGARLQRHPHGMDVGGSCICMQLQAWAGEDCWDSERRSVLPTLSGMSLFADRILSLPFSRVQRGTPRTELLFSRSSA